MIGITGFFLLAALIIIALDALGLLHWPRRSRPPERPPVDTDPEHVSPEWLDEQRRERDGRD